MKTVKMMKMAKMAEMRRNDDTKEIQEAPTQPQFMVMPRTACRFDNAGSLCCRFDNAGSFCGGFGDAGSFCLRFDVAGRSADVDFRLSPVGFGYAEFDSGGC